MGLLDGDLQGVFGAAFGVIYLDGALHRRTVTYSRGDATVAEADAAIKGQVDQISEVFRAQAGYTDREQRIIVLQNGVFPAPTTDDEITLGGVRWQISRVEADPANTHWVLRGQPA